jgi:hypothetical protein
LPQAIALRRNPSAELDDRFHESCHKRGIPHKVRYYLEQLDPDFAEKMAEVLCVYRQVSVFGL